METNENLDIENIDIDDLIFLIEYKILTEKEVYSVLTEKILNIVDDNFLYTTRHKYFSIIEHLKFYYIKNQQYELASKLRDLEKKLKNKPWKYHEDE